MHRGKHYAQPRNDTGNLQAGKVVDTGNTQQHTGIHMQHRYTGKGQVDSGWTESDT